MKQNQITLLSDLKASKERGAASMSCNQRLAIAEELVAMKLIEPYGYGYRISERGLKKVKQK